MPNTKQSKIREIEDKIKKSSNPQQREKLKMQLAALKKSKPLKEATILAIKSFLGEASVLGVHSAKVMDPKLVGIRKKYTVDGVYGDTNDNASKNDAEALRGWAATRGQDPGFKNMGHTAAAQADKNLKNIKRSDMWKGKNRLHVVNEAKSTRENEGESFLKSKGWQIYYKRHGHKRHDTKGLYGQSDIEHRIDTHYTHPDHPHVAIKTEHHFAPGSNKPTHTNTYKWETVDKEGKRINNMKYMGHKSSDVEHYADAEKTPIHKEFHLPKQIKEETLSEVSKEKLLKYLKGTNDELRNTPLGTPNALAKRHDGVMMASNKLSGKAKVPAKNPSFLRKLKKKVLTNQNTTR